MHKQKIMNSMVGDRQIDIEDNSDPVHFDLGNSEHELGDRIVSCPNSSKNIILHSQILHLTR